MNNKLQTCTDLVCGLGIELLCTVERDLQSMDVMKGYVFEIEKSVQLSETKTAKNYTGM